MELEKNVPVKDLAEAGRLARHYAHSPGRLPIPDRSMETGDPVDRETLFTRRAPSAPNQLATIELQPSFSKGAEEHGKRHDAQTMFE